MNGANVPPADIKYPANYNSTFKGIKGKTFLIKRIKALDMPEAASKLPTRLLIFYNKNTMLWRSDHSYERTFVQLILNC